MSPVRTDCPTLVDLTAFQQGQLDEARAKIISGHLAQCSDCREKMKQLPPGTLLGQLREAKKQPISSPSKVTPSLASSSTKGGGAGQMAAAIAIMQQKLLGHEKFEAIQLIGSGGMGAVFRARHRHTKIDVAIKCAQSNEAELVWRFQREVEVAAALGAHGNIVIAHDAEPFAEMMVLVMEYIDGADLAAVVKRSGSQLPIKHVCHYLLQAAIGLQHIHKKGFVHRDLKPQNFMVSRSDHVVKITDYGLAKKIGDPIDPVTGTRQGEAQPGATLARKTMGTPEFMPPEQIDDAANADARADIYSLGCTAYFMLAGRAPFPLPYDEREEPERIADVLAAHITQTPERLDAIRLEVPKELADLVARMLAKNPADRPHTALEVAKTLKTIQTTNNIIPQVAKPVVNQEKKEETFWMPNQPVVAANAGQSVWKEINIDDTHEEQAKAKPRLVRKVAKASWWKTPIGLAAIIGASFAFLCVVAAIIVIQVRTQDGVIELTVDPQDAEVKIDGDTISVKPHGDKEPIEIRKKPGVHKLEVRKGGFKIDSRELTLTAGGHSQVNIRLVPEQKIAERPKDNHAPNDLPKKNQGLTEPPQGNPEEDRPNASGANDGFVPLFNLKDLTGWQTHPKQSDDWSVKNGVLIGTGTGVGQPARFLYSERDAYTDFHLRIEARVSNGCYGVVTSRCIFSPDSFPPDEHDPIKGYGAVINGANGNPNKTGSLRLGKGMGVARVSDPPVPENQWFTLEMIAVWDRVVVKVDGRTTADYRDPDRRYARGRFILHPMGSQIEFRKIEIKELPAAKAEQESFVPLFNGKNLTGWNRPTENGGTWDVKSGELVGKGGGQVGRPSLLETVRNDFGDFRLRMEISNPDDTSKQIVLRAEINDGKINGYRIRLNGTDAPYPDVPAGSISKAVAAERGAVITWDTPAKHVPVEDGRPYILEVTAIGNTITTYVNGAMVAEYKDIATAFHSGRILLICRAKSDAEIHFRKIEIQDLQPAKREDRFAPLFNGKDLTGWKQTADSTTHWGAKGGSLTGVGAHRPEAGALVYQQDEFSDFKLRVKAVVGQGLIMFRGRTAGTNSQLEGYYVSLTDDDVGTVGTFGIFVPTTPYQKLAIAEPVKFKSGQVILVDITAEKNVFSIDIDGKRVVSFTDERNTYTKGSIALRCGKDSSISVRSVEIKKLP